MLVVSIKNKLSNELNIEELSNKYPLFDSTHNYLLKKYNKCELTVSETLHEIQMGPTDFYDKKKKGRGIPCYRQSDKKRSKIYFPIVCVALFLAQDFIKTGD